VNGQWEILLGRDFGVTLEWLRLLGVDAVLVNEKHSKELFHDYHTPEKFAGKLPVLYDDHAGNLIYEVPRRYRSLARVVDRRAFDALPSIPGNGDQASLGAWSAVLEQGPDAPTTTEWKGTDELVVRAPVKAGQSVFVQVSYDTNWRAYSGASRLPVRNTKTGLMLIDAPAGTQELRLLFPTPRSNQVGRVVTGLTILLSAALLFQFRRPSKVSA
ncbi:MAG TPA: hypothetical protein VEQ63_15390, partial [Bryobacteraceae bacterium]|nr:hypothetical protein [Bryobacteraceae bacterium]